MQTINVLSDDPDSFGFLSSSANKDWAGIRSENFIRFFLILVWLKIFQRIYK